MADQKRDSLENPQGKDQNDDENRNPEQQSRDTLHPSSTQTSATRVSHNETHTPMDWDTTGRKTLDQSDHHLASTDVERSENMTSCQDVQANTSGDVVGTETHTSVQSQETSFRDSENQLVETRTTTQVGEKNTIINKTVNYVTNTGNQTHVHNHFHYSCPPPPHHHGDSSSSYHVPCPDCLPYHHNDHLPLAEIHRPQPESEPRHLGLPHHPVPQLPPGPQQTQHTESSQERVAQNLDSKHRSQETVCQTSRASDVTPMPNVTRQEARPVKTADSGKKEDGQSHNTKTASESGETRRVCNEGVRDTLCILDFKGRAVEPGDALWIGHQFWIFVIYVGNQQVVYCPGRDKMVVKKELAMPSPFGKLSVSSDGRCQVYPPRDRLDRATAMIGRMYTEGDVSDEWDFPHWVYTGMGGIEASEKGFMLY